jgi:hypothetical protein
VNPESDVVIAAKALLGQCKVLFDMEGTAQDRAAFEALGAAIAAPAQQAPSERADVLMAQEEIAELQRQLDERGGVIELQRLRIAQLEGADGVNPSSKEQQQ